MSKFPPLNTIPLYHSSLGALEQPGEVNIRPQNRKSHQQSQPDSDATGLIWTIRSARRSRHMNQV